MEFPANCKFDSIGERSCKLAQASVKLRLGRGTNFCFKSLGLRLGWL